MLTRVGGGNMMILWDVNTGREIRTIGGVGADHIAFSPDGHKAVTGGGNGVNAITILWNLDSGKPIHLFEGSFLSHPPISDTCVDFSSDGHYILSAELEESIILWDAHTYEKVRSFLTDSNMTGTSKGRIHSIKFSPDGRFALSAGDRLILWNVETGRISRIFKGKKNASHVNAIISLDGRFVMSGGWDRKFNNLIIWSMESGEPLQSIHLEYVPEIISFSPDGRFSVTGRKYSSDSIEVWDIEKRALSIAIPIPKGKEGVSFSMSPDSRKAAIGFCGRLELWDIETGKIILTFRPEPTLPLILLDTILKYVKI
jgi:WD40 repeat protein